MDNRNYVNSDYYAKLLRDKVKRDSKVAKMQNKLVSEQQQKQLKPLCPKKPKKLSEKWLKQETYEKPPAQDKNVPTNKAHSGRDLLGEIDDSLGGSAKGFLLKKGN
jgi:hypothetical protein